MGRAAPGGHTGKEINTLVQSKACRLDKVSQRLLQEAQEGGKQIEHFQSVFKKTKEPISCVSLCPRYTVYSNVSHTQLLWTGYAHVGYSFLGRCISVCKSGLLIPEALWDHYSESCRVLLRPSQGKNGRVPMATVIWENLIKSPWCKSQRYLLKESSSFVIPIWFISRARQGKGYRLIVLKQDETLTGGTGEQCP